MHFFLILSQSLLLKIACGDIMVNFKIIWWCHDSDKLLRFSSISIHGTSTSFKSHKTLLSRCPAAISNKLKNRKIEFFRTSDKLFQNKHENVMNIVYITWNLAITVRCKQVNIMVIMSWSCHFVKHGEISVIFLCRKCFLCVEQLIFCAEKNFITVGKFLHTN